eukprot:1001690-Pyramimonas_sp.AAC.1
MALALSPRTEPHGLRASGFRSVALACSAHTRINDLPEPHGVRTGGFQSAAPAPAPRTPI